MSTIFIAVQCCQCSTMQVKQQKKSSNKWICVVCNQKQSVRKVFAQGFIAKEVRKFVQSFNMSRKLSDENLISPSEEIDYPPQNSNSYNQRKRRSDWTEYLDTKDDEDHIGEAEREEQRGGGFEPEIVTELPKEMFKRPKLKNYSAGLNMSEGKKPFKPIFSKRKNNIPTISQDKPRKSEPTKAQGPSKWNDYLTEDDDELLFGEMGNSHDPLGSWSRGVFEAQFNDQRVEDDIHPHFN